MIRRLLPFALAALLLAAGFAALDQYNATWDEAGGDLFFGQRYFAFFTTFEGRYLDFATNPPHLSPDLRSAPFRGRPWEHYPVASTLATASSRLFTALHLLDPFDGYHAFNLLLGAGFLLLLYRVVDGRLGTLPAVATTLLLFLSPRIVGDLMANVKDFSEMVFFSAAALAFAYALERGSPRLLLGAGAILGLALGTKANALFLPPIVILYLLLRRVPPAWRGRERQLVAALAGAFAVAALIFFVAWPYLWDDPIAKLQLNLRYIALRKSGTAAAQTTSPFVMIALTMPPAFLLAFALGLVPLARRARAREPLALLVVSWLAVVAARLALPAAVNFDGVRHFLELFPPMAITGGMAVAMLRRPLVAAAAVVALITPIALAEAHVHPFESCYWNVFARGLKGAMQRRIPQACDYWAASYRLGIRWLDAHAEANALLAVPIAEHAVRVVAPARLRLDIGLAHITTPFTPRAQHLDRFYADARTRPAYVMFVFRRDWSNALVADALSRFQPVAVWRLDGAPVLAVFRVTPNSVTRVLPSANTASAASPRP
jgi:hypothetical protein